LWFEDKDKDLSLKDEDKDKDLKIGPRGQGLSSRTTTLMTERRTNQQNKFFVSELHVLQAYSFCALTATFPIAHSY